MAGGGGGGVMTSMQVRIVSSVSFVSLLLIGCRLLCEALVAASCCFTFETSARQKPSFPDKNFATDPENHQKEKAKNMVFATISQNAPKKQDQKKTMENNNLKHQLVDENHKTQGFQVFHQKTYQK